MHEGHEEKCLSIDVLPYSPQQELPGSVFSDDGLLFWRLGQSVGNLRDFGRGADGTPHGTAVLITQGETGWGGNDDCLLIVNSYFSPTFVVWIPNSARLEQIRVSGLLSLLFFDT